MISKKISIEKKTYLEREAFAAKAPFPYSLEDTLECGQCFRHELVKKTDGYVEYVVPVGNLLVRVGQAERGELIFFDTDEKTVRVNKKLGEIIVPVKMQVTRDQTERPHGASLQINIDIGYVMYRIGGRLRDEHVSVRGVAVGIPPFAYLVSN